MKRLGDLLVAAGGLDAEELEKALRAQVMWGGRLGTNLIELGYIDLDELARVLGKQRGMPAALAHHFEKADKTLQEQLPVELVEKLQIVPLLRLDDGRIALASMDPLDEQELAEISAAFGVEPHALVVSVACEQRMRYQMERVYNIHRGPRFLRSRGATIPPFPVFGDFESEPDSEVEIPIDWEEEATPTPEPEPIAFGRADTDALAAAIEQAAATAPPSAEPSGPQHRAYVQTLADASEDQPTPKRERKSTRPKKALGRLALRKVAVTPATGAAVEGAEPRDTDSLADAARAIRRSPDRDRVADLVMDALDRFAPGCEAAMLFVIRGQSATAWKYFRRAGGDQPELALPTDEPGLVPRAIETAVTARCKASELAGLDRRLLQALAGGDELAVVPIAIAGKVMCLLAIGITAGTQIGVVETIATSAGTAFARLMRDAGR